MLLLKGLTYFLCNENITELAKDITIAANQDIKAQFLPCIVDYRWGGSTFPIATACSSDIGLLQFNFSNVTRGSLCIDIHLS